MNLLIKGGRVIDPASGYDQLADVAVSHGVVSAVGAIGAACWGGYHLPSDACHQPGPCEVSLMFSPSPLRGLGRQRTHRRTTV